jgi:hypothetical protein
VARIRTIKPEIPQSESFGRLSRDARLCFVQLWTLADDAGRLRGNSRALASLLYPYDDDAPALIDDWLHELEQENCIRRYEIDGNKYLDIPNWLKHQKIDKPSESKIPAFNEASRIFSKPRECSSLDLDQGPGSKDQGGEGNTPPSAASTSSIQVSRETFDEDEDVGETDFSPEVEAMRAWNIMAAQHGLSVVQKFGPKRRKHTRARLDDAGLDGWMTALEKVSASSFLLGKNKDGWRADYDFFVTDSKFTKILEGAYDGKPNGAGSSAGITDIARDLIAAIPHESPVQ